MIPGCTTRITTQLPGQPMATSDQCCPFVSRLVCATPLVRDGRVAQIRRQACVLGLKVAKVLPTKG